MKEFKTYIDDLKKLISYKSVISPAKDGMPFGEECYKALTFCLDRAEEMGFKTINYDGYAGEVVYGEGEEVGIMGHLDVVPTGIGWASDPFTLTYKDGAYYGRGILDDKGATLMCLYALNALKNSGEKPNRKFRLFFGTNEESGWKDVDYLKTKTKLPEYGFSPDANFPLSYAEKGVTVVEITIPPLKKFSSVKGGTAINAVCDYATATANSDAIDQTLLGKYNLKLVNGAIIESYGKAAHGSAPHLGKNAILPLLEYMRDVGEDLDGVIDNLFRDKQGITKLNNEQGNVTLSPDLISVNQNGEVVIKCDCRIPAPLSTADIIPLLDKTGLNYTAETHHQPMVVEKEGWFVKTLMSAYRAVTGLQSEPISLGGVTFARVFEKGCAFGPALPKTNGNCHDANEFIQEKDLKTAYEIYEKAIFALNKKQL